MKDKNVCEVNKRSTLFSLEHFLLPLQACSLETQIIPRSISALTSLVISGHNAPLSDMGSIWKIPILF